MDTKDDLESKNVWNEDTYEAWVERFGKPKEAAEKLKNNPDAKLYPILQYFGDVKDKKILNLMGSNGTKAVSLALLGAKAAVIDISSGNAKYARELAVAAGVEIKYVISDVLAIPKEEQTGDYDIVFAEQGILHYFTDLKAFFDIAYDLLHRGGRFVIRDFHPISTKLISSRGSTAKVRKHKVDGDYFDTSLEEKEVSFAKYLTDGVVHEKRTVYWRRWTLGEIVTAVSQAGFCIKLLSEEPNLSSEVFDKGIPKTYTIVADK
ncbi:MAG: SAM-dependent methyltransferase [Clostridia bacterium]|jgi:SAM-dependent methyltransferase|nr:SAM-dependent methyltransferase [Clostridia bacterium]